MSMKDQVDAFAEAAEPGSGPQNYAERRLLEIAKAADSIAFWVRLWSVLTLIGFVITFIAYVAAAS